MSALPTLTVTRPLSSIEYQIEGEYGSAAGAWKQGEEKALQFARQVDAESFVETYLAHAAMLIETTETRHG